MTIENKSLEEVVKEFAESTNQAIGKLSQEVRQVNKQLGELGNRFGYYTEGLAFSSVEMMLESEFGITELTQNSRRKKSPTERIEIDVLGTVNSTLNRAVVVEVKTQLSEDSINQLLDILQKFPNYYPEHKDKTLYGLLCCVAMPKESLKLKLKQLGIYLATVRGEVFGLDNDVDFMAKDYKLV